MLAYPRVFALSLSIALVSAVAFAQTKPAFEVASIKASPPLPANGMMMSGMRGGPGSPDPSHITGTNATLQSVLTTAFDVKSFQLVIPSSMNPWINSDRFDFEVKLPDGATKEQVRLMWQSLLAERFGLVVRHESKEYQVEQLVVGKGGPKLKESGPNSSVRVDDAPPRVENGQLKGPGFMTMINLDPSKGALASTIATEQTMEPLAAMLTSQRGHLVIDKTGLTAKYDYTLTFAPNLAGIRLPPGAANAAASGAIADPNAEADITTALQEQLGLRLVSGKAPLDTIVIEKLEKVPTDN